MFIKTLSGTVSIQGKRLKMEDSHIHLDDLAEHSKEFDLRGKKLSYYQICDGHGGKVAASLAKNKLTRQILSHPRLFDDTEFAIKEALANTDHNILVQEQMTGDSSGCTVLIGMTIDNVLWVANAGDSEAVLSICNKGKWDTWMLTQVHRPTESQEKARILEAGGNVCRGRVEGSLAVSRGLGDPKYKAGPISRMQEDLVTSDPFVQKVQFKEGDEGFIIFACDGLWDFVDKSQVVQMTREIYSTQEVPDPQKTADFLVKTALEARSTDNITVIVVYFKVH